MRLTSQADHATCPLVAPQGTLTAHEVNKVLTKKNVSEAFECTVAHSVST